MTGTRLERIAVALDTDDRDTYSDWCCLFGPRVGVLKVGPRVVLRWGRDAVREAAATGADVFLDMKFHDIPSTVAGAVGAAKELGVTYLTVHAGGGRRMLEAAAEEAGDEVRVLGITVLTHLDADDLHDLDLPGEAGDRVLSWARSAQAAGCAGVVCSPLELATLRARLGPELLLVSPGIRFDSAAVADDQRRVASPSAALRAGADLLVIGRPLTQAPDPEAALAALTEACE
ncbi:MAG: orotidine-5'-phosphate decarboxylase [Acidobacteriota bacterium]|nr:orotidine-5'-phosphate decarboxylase [Acidobacteriota bacterium]